MVKVTVDGQRAMNRLRTDANMGNPGGTFGGGVGGGARDGGSAGAPISKNVTPNPDGMKGGTPWTNQHGSSQTARPPAGVPNPRGM